MSAFLDSITSLPSASMPQLASDTQDVLTNQLSRQQAAALVPITRALAGNSEFLSMLITRESAYFSDLCADGPQIAYEKLMQSLTYEAASLSDSQQLMGMLRRARARMALLTATADISGLWDVKTVTQRLSAFADLTIQLCANTLLLQAHRKGSIILSDPNQPHLQSGLLILAMGKLGSCELNYSSDIDLIILFDAEALEYRGRRSIQHFFSALAQDLCRLLQERTRDGYVFRTDLRLRPDPRSTPLAVKLSSAIAYYENLGQNWERAAMIKARPVYADPNTQTRFDKAMQAFIWRKHLDFEAINDIHSIKRQINARIGESLEMRGHNVKLGRGGIREIEFFLQTQQLIRGGRERELRSSGSDETLSALLETGHIDEQTYHALRDAYWFLRRVEHHIQMLHDQQTHTIPEDEQTLAQLSCFLGYETIAAFEADLLHHCRRVHDIYADSNTSAPSLSYDGNLVFTGVEADPETLKTLAKMGFSKPLIISDAIQSWHRGARRATRSLKARQILTELIPALLTSFTETPNPDDAFKRFDEFIAKVPVGVQIFSLLAANPEIMKLLSMILGSAPAVSESLARAPALLDMLLERETALPKEEALRQELAGLLAEASDDEAALRLLRQFKQEKSFHAGVKLLSGDIGLETCGQYLSMLADVIIAKTYHVCAGALTQKYGQIDGAEFAILGLGKLGTQELTFGSDLDVILLYSTPDRTSTGARKSIDAASYFQRLSSRLTHAFTLASPEGRLYELDMRLRPGGNSGPLATHIARLEAYFQHDGWDVEALGLTRARVVFATSKDFARQVEHSCLSTIERGFSPDTLARSIHTLRTRIAQHFPTKDPWNVKYMRGGLMDISFIAQYLRLVHPEAFAGQIGQSNLAIFAAAATHGLITQAQATQLMQHYRLQRDVQHVLRLCSTAQTITPASRPGLQKRVARLMQRADCNMLRNDLIESLHHTAQLFDILIGRTI